MVEERAGGGRDGAAHRPQRRVSVRVAGCSSELVVSGVEIRILHASPPSCPSARSCARLRHVKAGNGRRGSFELRLCPRVHCKTRRCRRHHRCHLGSANWTGAGLGAKGEGRRNFGAGVASAATTCCWDDVQAFFDAIWRGQPCTDCKRRDLCPQPLG